MLTGASLGGGAATGGGGGDGGATGGGTATCSMSCGGTTPICDPASNSCKTCTETQGCSGLTPVCSTIANGGFGRCVVCTVSSGCQGATPFCDPTVQPAGACHQCRSTTDCTGGLVCEPVSGQCVVNDGGFGGGQGGGSGQGGGGQAGGPVTITWDDVGMTQRCLARDAGQVEACPSGECKRGFVCLGGQCVLRGQSGPVQVTLRWPDDDDVDLHVVEPLPDGGACEIWYGMPNVDASVPFPLPFPLPNRTCGAKGWLDLDSNAKCDLDHVRVENVIYPPNLTPTAGTYIVRVDYWEDCAPLHTAPIPYEVEVRANGDVRYYCGTLNRATGGSAGGRHGHHLHAALKRRVGLEVACQVEPRNQTHASHVEPSQHAEVRREHPLAEEERHPLGLPPAKKSASRNRRPGWS